MIRRDIQSMRGIAVLLVVAYHAGLGGFRHGYLGVDVFFVISGFLMTRMITKSIDEGRFTFFQFYWRRAKRLLPAAYVVLAGTSAFATLLLTESELRSFLRQLLGSLTFCANVVLWRQANYFDLSSDLKPLLHMWSLSLETRRFEPASSLHSYRRSLGSQICAQVPPALWTMGKRFCPVGR
jgi:peptidoglycan/LPS O-acetylase OafA/YrhL